MGKIGPKEQAMIDARNAVHRRSAIRGPAETVAELQRRADGVPVPRGIGVKRDKRARGTLESVDRSTVPHAVGRRAPTPATPSGVSRVSIHLKMEADVHAAWKGSGPGWQTRINELLRREMPR